VELALVLVAGYHTVVGSVRDPRASDSCRVATVNVFDGARGAGGAGLALGLAEGLAPVLALGSTDGEAEPDAATSPEGAAVGSACHRGESEPQAASARQAAIAADARAWRGKRTGRL
jgi:hypothetical protein